MISVGNGDGLGERGLKRGHGIARIMVLADVPDVAVFDAGEAVEVCAR